MNDLLLISTDDMNNLMKVDIYGCPVYTDGNGRVWPKPYEVKP